jgi:hypothetical protein
VARKVVFCFTFFSSSAVPAEPAAGFVPISVKPLSRLRA